MNQLLFIVRRVGDFSFGSAQEQTNLSTFTTITYHTTNIGGLNIFYREAGPKDAQTLLLLHGFLSSSRMFDTLIPLLADRYHIIAPNYPSFGQSDTPPPVQYAYPFDHIAQTWNSSSRAWG